MNLRRFLMNAVNDPRGSGGGDGGATPAATPQPQGGTPVDMKAMAAEMAAVIGPQVRDFVLGEARRAGVFKGGKEKGGGVDPPESQTQTTQTGTGEQPLTHAAVAKMLERRDALHQALSGTSLSAGAHARIVRDMERDAPEDVGAWAKVYLSDFGVGVAASANPNANPNNATASEQQRRPPVTNIAAPAGPSSTEVRDPYALTQDDVNSMVRQDGMYKTGQKLMEALRRSPRRRLGVRRR
jgi:hypothetical protein